MFKVLLLLFGIAPVNISDLGNEDFEVREQTQKTIQSQLIFYYVDLQFYSSQDPEIQRRIKDIGVLKLGRDVDREVFKNSPDLILTWIIAQILNEPKELEFNLFYSIRIKDSSLFFNEAVRQAKILRLPGAWDNAWDRSIMDNFVPDIWDGVLAVNYFKKILAERKYPELR